MDLKVRKKKIVTRQVKPIHTHDTYGDFRWPAADSFSSCSTGGRDADGNSDGDGDGNCCGSDRGKLCGSDTCIRRQYCAMMIR